MRYSKENTKSRFAPLSQLSHMASTNLHRALSSRFCSTELASPDNSAVITSLTHSCISDKTFETNHEVVTQFDDIGTNGGIPLAVGPTTALSESVKCSESRDMYNLTMSKAIVLHWVGLRRDNLGPDVCSNW